ncbi:transmembrane 7 superfamily member 3-like [Artemia franciscana]|uniref:TM7S3/TM198-like domain-containing protein n=1 Tax=Artemia franciscana TaxID=6661 RepID=A0AA88HPE8_ARTSF|nr:hypothetical protein QYM36_010218 [Artemia franciscana]
MNFRRNLQNSFITLLILFSTGDFQESKITALDEVKLDSSVQPNDEMLLMHPNSAIRITAINVPSTARYILMQAHSHFHNVTLSYDINPVEDRFVTGRNLGLLVENRETNNTKPLFLKYEANGNNSISILIFSHIISYKDPIPGACNVEFSVELAPYLHTRFNNYSITVEHQPALSPYPKRSSRPSCENEFLEYELYHSYLSPMEFTEELYFQKILQMSDLETAREIGREIRLFGFAPKTRSKFANYPGIGQVFSVVVTSKLSNVSSVYVPAASYGCDPVLEECQTINTPFSKSLAAASFMIGLFLAFFGHSYFKLELFFMGFLALALTSFVIVSRESALEIESVTLVAAFSGIIGGGIWLAVWYIRAEPALSVLVPTILLGFLSACCVYYVPLNFEYLVSDFNFWASFISCMLFLPVLLIVISWQANIIACAVIGSYLILAPIGHYLGSSIAYILLNILRRATIPSYGHVVLDPPFHYYDQIMIGIWIALAFLAATFQFLREWKNPLFPNVNPLPHLPWFKPRRGLPRLQSQFPMPFSRERASGETTPLIGSLPSPFSASRDKSYFSSL